MLPFPSRSRKKLLVKKLENDTEIEISDPSQQIFRIIRRRKRKKRNSGEEKCQISTALDTDGLVNLSIDSNERKRLRKAYSNRPDHMRRCDPTSLVDLEFVCDYDEYFRQCIDPKIKLNTKGPLANLWFGFKVNKLIN
jgi:hypothetical protein